LHLLYNAGRCRLKRGLPAADPDFSMTALSVRFRAESEGTMASTPKKTPPKAAKKPSASAGKTAAAPKKPATAAKTPAAAKARPAAAAAKKAAAAPAAPKKSATAGKPAAVKKASPAAAKKPAGAAPKPATAPKKPKIDASRPIGDGPAWDGDPAKVPDYKEDTDWVEAVRSQFGLIRGFPRKVRAVAILLLRFLP
jgi:hypothetical protein